MDIWRLSNTGVRNPLRIQDGLRAYSRSVLVSDIRSREKEIALGNYLAKEGILSNANDPDGTYGRKWRFAWNTFGYTVTQVKSNWKITQKTLGEVDSITPLGKALILILNKILTKEQKCAIIVKGDNYGKEIRNQRRRIE